MLRRLALWLAMYAGALMVAGFSSLSTASEDRADPRIPRVQSLAGTWDILPGHADEDLYRPEVAAQVGGWGRVPVPGLWPHATGLGEALDGRAWAQVEYVWYRRRFDVPREAKYRRAVLRLAAVRWGSKVWLNGREVGGHLGAFRVTDFDVTDFLNPGASNELVMRLTGWPVIPRSAADDKYLIPAGSAPHSWGLKVGGVVEGIALHYCDEAFIRSARILADPATGTVSARIRFRNYGFHYGLIGARLEVRRDDRLVASAEQDFGRFISLTAKREDQFIEVETRVAKPDLWSPEAPNLYSARITLLHDGRASDIFEERFGFRAFEIRDRRFYLNGKPIFLRGTNYVGESAAPLDRFPTADLVKRYLRDVPALFHGNCLRPHSLPLSVRWLEAADECGAMILQEFPLTVNYETFDFTPAEDAAFKANVESEYATMIELYWNHPSIIMWVPTNESPRWEEWENGPLYRLFKSLDPSRPVLRAGRVSPDVYDTHCYDGWWQGSEGDFDHLMTESAQAARRAGLPFTNTEYIENASKQRGYRFLGPALDAMSPDGQRRALEDLRAEVTAQQSECLRRLGAQLILHYMWHQVRNWEDPAAMDPSPSFYALKHAYAPVGVSIECFNRHFEAGQPLTTPVHLMNGTNDGARGTLEVMILTDEPPWSWDGAASKDAVWRQTLPERRLLGPRAIRVPPMGREVLDVHWPMPKAEGRYVLAAVWREQGREPVVSRRVVFAVAPPDAAPLAGRRVAVWEVGGALAAWLKGRGADVVPLPEAQVALVGPDIHRSPTFARAVTDLRQWVEAGGRLVVLEQSKWVHDDLVKVDTPIIGMRSGISTVFRKDRPDHPMWRGVPEAWMRRWNGLPGTIARHALTTDLKHDALAIGTDRTEFPKTEVCAEVPVGKGKVIFCQFRIVDRLDRSSDAFDPVAERLLINLVSE